MSRRQTCMARRPEGQVNAAKHHRRTVMGMPDDGYQIFALET